MPIQNSFKSLLSSSTRQHRSKKRRSSQLTLVALEDRTTPSTFTVSKTADSGFAASHDAGAGA